MASWPSRQSPLPSKRLTRPSRRPTLPSKRPIRLTGRTRLEARLQPVIPVDASGQARLDDEVGTGNDRFTSEVEIAKADFADLGITPGNGFRDEVVELRVLRGGVLIFSNRLHFSRNLLNDITFETDIRGTAAPELRAGDVARLIVNGHFTLRGSFQVH